MSTSTVRFITALVLIAHGIGYSLAFFPALNITKVDNWGRRRLAYPIQEFREGYYIFIEMNFPTQRVGELEYNLKFSDQIIRHLVIRLDED